MSADSGAGGSLSAVIFVSSSAVALGLFARLPGLAVLRLAMIAPPFGVTCRDPTSRLHVAVADMRVIRVVSQGSASRKGEHERPRISPRRRRQLDRAVDRCCHR